MSQLLAPAVPARPPAALLASLLDGLVVPDGHRARQRWQATVTYVAAALALALFGGALVGYQTKAAAASGIGLLPLTVDSPGSPPGDGKPAVPAPVAPADLAATVEKAQSQAPAEPPAEPAPPGKQLPLPVGKGMWIWLPEKVHGADVDAMVAQAVASGLTHVYVRTGSSRQGFHDPAYLNEVLPKAHAAGIRVYGWDFPYLYDTGADVQRAMQAITHQAPGGHRIDGFVADIETPSEGTQLTGAAAAAYGHGLRDAAGDSYPLIVAVPRPSPATIARYPFDAIVEPFSAIAPMVYWLNRQPDTDAIGAMEWLSRYDKPIIPVGQAYEGLPEGGRPGPPTRDEIQRFISASESRGAIGVSFWSWQHASPDVWGAIAEAPQLRLPALGPEHLRPEEVRVVQALIASQGYPIPITGVWDKATTKAVKTFQKDAGLRPTGHFDAETKRLALQPVPVPLGR